MIEKTDIKIYHKLWANNMPVLLTCTSSLTHLVTHKRQTRCVTFRDINYLFTFTEKWPHQDNVVITIGNRTQHTEADVVVTTQTESSIVTLCPLSKVSYNTKCKASRVAPRPPQPPSQTDKTHLILKPPDPAFFFFTNPPDLFWTPHLESRDTG